MGTDPQALVALVAMFVVLYIISNGSRSRS